MTSGLAARWTAIDRWIQTVRFGRVGAEVPTGAVVLDLGCGTGDFLRWLEPRLKRGFGLDARVADGELSEKVRIETSDLEEPIPFPEASVDTVTALALVEHLRNPGALVREVLRVLQPGGRFVLTTPAPAARPVLEFLAFRLGVISKADIADHKHYFSRAELKSLVAEFSSVRVEGFLLNLNQLVVAQK